MIHTIQNRFSLNVVLTVLFIFGIGASLYFIYSLPVSLRLADGYQPRFLPVYVVFGVTSLIGVLTLIQALRYKDEVVVFRDKIVDKEEARKEEAELAGKTTISLDTVKSSLEEGILKTALTAALHSLCKQLDAGQGALYISKEEQGKRLVELTAGYALSMGESTVVRFEFGEGLIGQVASTGQSLYVDEVPQGYITILSGLGSASPRYVLIVPVKNNQSVTGVIEIASFTRATDDQRKFVEEAAHLISEKILKNG